LLALAPRDLDLTLRLMRRARLLGRLGWQLSEHVSLDSLPHPVGDHLLSAFLSAQARSQVGRWELNRIAWALGAGVTTPLIALKGCGYLLAMTPNAPGRMFNDIDLLGHRDHLPAVEMALRAHGWRSSSISAYDERYYRRWAHQLPPLKHFERDAEVDLHHNILMPTARRKPSAALLFAEARAVPASPFRVLAPIDMTLHAMTHLLMGEMVDGLRELVDIDQLLRHFGDQELDFWQRFWARAEQLDLARPAYYGLRYASRVLETPVPPDLIAASRSAAPAAPILALMDNLLPDALFPPHPDASGGGSWVVRRLLLARSHWLRMPPFVLARHLGYKFCLKHWSGNKHSVD
jgi:hypothetical protein